jgi:hypothetical protein
MGVEIISFGRGGSMPATQYAETFNRVDQPFFLGNNWNFQPTISCADAPSAMAASVNVGAGSATIGGPASLNARSYFTPAFVDRAAVTSGMLTRGEFSQFTIRNVVPGLTGDFGPMVYNPNPNDSNGYMMLLGSSTGIARLFRDMGPGATQLVANLFTFLANDIVRLEVTPGVASNSIRSFKNGVLQNTFVDNNALRPTAGGHYGIAWFSNNVGSISFSDYFGGLL